MTDSIENTGSLLPEQPQGGDSPDAPQVPTPSAKPKYTFKRLYKEWILPFGLEIIALWLLVHFVCFLPVVPTSSMAPTIREHSLLFAWRVSDPAKLQRGDIVVFDSEETGKNLIKRLIGLPGDTVFIDSDGKVYINGTPSEESYVVNQVTSNIAIYLNLPQTYTVPEGCYLFFGDNRANSYDARYWKEKYIPAANIKGKAVFTLFPFSNFGALK